MNRRAYIGIASSALAASVAGCLTGEPEEEDDEHACPKEEWPVVLYNQSSGTKSMTVSITDAENQNVFSDTIEIDPDTDQFSGIELDTKVSYEQSYTFEATLSGGKEATTETTVNCGNVYIFVTKSGEVDIRDDRIDHV